MGALRRDRPRFFFPVQNQTRVGRVVERHDIERYALIDYHSTEKYLDCLGHVKAKTA
jgi:hypothetical protein